MATPKLAQHCNKCGCWLRVQSRLGGKRPRDPEAALRRRLRLSSRPFNADIIERCAGGKERHHICFRYSGAYRSQLAEWWLATDPRASPYRHICGIPRLPRASPVMAQGCRLWRCGKSAAPGYSGPAVNVIARAALDPKLPSHLLIYGVVRTGVASSLGLCLR